MKWGRRRSRSIGFLLSGRRAFPFIVRLRTSKSLFPPSRYDQLHNSYSQATIEFAKNQPTHTKKDRERRRARGMEEREGARE